MVPWKYIEDFQHDPIIQEEEKPHENQAHEDQIEQKQEREIEEGNYITGIKTIGDEKEEGYIS